jgi:asparagine synthase (glutamine-hydrolysing)
VVTTALVISFAPEVPAPRRESLLARARAALAVRDGDVHADERPFDDGLVLVTGRSLDTGPLSLTHPARAESLLPVPPGGWLELGQRSVVAVTDHLGFKHLCLTGGDGWSAVCTSAMVLGAIAGRDLDEAAWADLALLGFLTRRRTLYDGIERVPGSTRVELAAGRATVSELVVSAPARDRTDGVEAIRAAVGAHLEVVPDAGLELSGGLDSRVLLAAVPRAQRIDRPALTVGTDDHPDVQLARRIADRYGMDHLVVPSSFPDTADPFEMLTCVRDAARRRDHLGDALAGALLDRVEGLAPQGPRLTGVNGEYVRGFYYPGTLPLAPVTRGQTALLVRWRMLANHRVDGALFSTGWIQDATERLIDELYQALRRTGLPLRPATDEFYLHDRVVGWAGASYSHAATGRDVLAPFLHPDFLAWVRSTPVHDRAGSAALSRCLVRLDPELAALEVAGGPPPVRQTAGVPTRLFRGGRRAGGKVLHKVAQRLTGRGRPPVGVDTVLGPLLRAWHEDDPRPSLGRAPFVSEAALERWARPGQPPDAATASFLVNLSGVVVFREEVDRRAAQVELARRVPDVVVEPTPGVEA